MTDIPKKLISDIEQLSSSHHDEMGIRLKALIESKREWFVSEVNASPSHRDLIAAHTSILDRILIALYSRGSISADGRVSIVALGGYGRMEVGLFSDMDLMILHSGVSPDRIKAITDEIFYPLWDSKFEIGGATRSIGDCRSLIKDDVKILTALLDARVVAGESSLVDELKSVIASHFSTKKNRSCFIEAKLSEREDRLRRVGNSICQLEPNIKEGRGGLRDYHTMHWAEMVHRFAYDEGFTIQPQPLDSFDFLLRVRHSLHSIMMRRTDLLSDSCQDDVARSMGISEIDGVSSAERLMSEYYRHACKIAAASEISIDRIQQRYRRRNKFIFKILKRPIDKRAMRVTSRGMITLRDGALDRDPSLALRLLAESRRLKLPIDPMGIEAITKMQFPDSVQDCEWELFRKLLTKPAELENILQDMNGANLLKRYLPELHRIYFLVQHDGMHAYTVGIHSIKAAGELGRMIEGALSDKGDRFTQPFKLVDRLPVLVLATLLHDIGKGRGVDHASTGAELAYKIAKRIGFSDKDSADAAFLVRSHLLFAEISFKRDLHDDLFIEKFSQSMRSAELLAMLYLLTCADLKAVSPHIWSDWKGSLLEELYKRTITFICDCEEVNSRAELILSSKLSKIARSLGADCSMDELNLFRSSLPERYLRTLTPETIAAHYIMMQELPDEGLSTVIRHDTASGYTELSIITRDRPGLFAIIAGVLSANGANILGAELFTSDSGFAIDVIWLSDSDGGIFEDSNKLNRLRDELKGAIVGGLDHGELFRGRLKSGMIDRSQRKLPASVEIENGVSAIETVIEISADDRIGLLYSIASAISKRGCTIERAKVTTKAKRVVDVFYVRKMDGGKLSDPSEIEKLRGDLIEAISV